MFWTIFCAIVFALLFYRFGIPLIIIFLDSHSFKSLFKLVLWILFIIFIIIGSVLWITDKVDEHNTRKDLEKQEKSNDELIDKYLDCWSINDICPQGFDTYIRDKYNLPKRSDSTKTNHKFEPLFCLEPCNQDQNLLQ